MNKTFKSTVSAVAVAFLTAVSTASAGLDLQGSFAFNSGFGDTSASYSSSSLKLASGNYVSGTAGDFNGQLVLLAFLTADSTEITGIGSQATPTTVSRPDYFKFSTAGYGGSTGTAPPNRFSFDLEKIYRLSASSFVGNGRLRDVTGVYSDMTASFTLSFTGPSNYSASFATITPVPEASTLWSGAGILVFGLGAGVRRMRRQSAV